MTQRYISRRLVLLVSGASVVALACGDDDEGDTSGAGAGGDGSTTSTTTASTTTGVGGAGTGGAHTGGAHSGGGDVCGAMLLVKGSNYGSDPHDLTIPLADFEAGVTKTYTTTGVGHTHTVTLTEADFAALQNGETVKKYICYTNPGSTDHEFVISCADPNIMPTFEGEIGTADNCPAS